MSLRDFTVTSLFAFPLALLILFSIAVTEAQVMESTNYKIESDSINFGGGLSTSTSYRLESTAGEIATGDSSSTNYNLRAGYQQMTTRFISMTAPGDVTMSPSIPGVTGGTANGSTTVTVMTDSAAGYSLSIASTESPSMVSGANSIDDYVPAGNPDFTMSTGNDEAHFGYSPSGVDTAARFLDDGANCNTGALETALSCWDGLDMAPEVIAQGSAANNPLGATTTVHFRVWVGGAVSQAEGVYTATTTLTALAL